MSRPPPRLSHTVPCGNTLGEGVLWDDRSGTALWTDIERRRLYRSVFPFSEVDIHPTPERLGSFGLLEDDALVAAFESGFGVFDWRHHTHRWLDRPALPPGCRFNDGRVDREGVFWAGTMVEDPARRSAADGALYRLGASGAEAVLDGVRISNSLCWSPDGTVMYFADTPRRAIWAFDFHGDSVSNRRVFAEIPAGAGPDGSTVDADGHLWNAQWGAGRAVRYAPDGRVDLVVDVPVPQVTCVAFGGPELRHLLITTARVGLNDAALAHAPDSGALFVYETPYQGLPESRCRLEPR